MKSIVLAVSLVFVPTAAFAQGAIGLDVAWDDDPEEFAIGVNAALHTGGVVDSSRLGLSARYFLIPNEDILGGELSSTFISFNVDGQYLFFKGFPALGYGILGLNLTYAEASAETLGVSISEDALGLGLNLGAGFEFRLGDTVSAFGEGKLVVPLADSSDDPSVDFNTRFTGVAGVRFYFGGGGENDMNLSDF